MQLPRACSRCEKLVEVESGGPVNHYNQSKFEVIDVIEAWKLGFNDGNAVKYIARSLHKGKPIEDLEKAAWYLNREIQRRKADV